MDWEGDRTKILRISVIKTTSATYEDDETNKCLMFICRWEKVIVTENNKGRIFYLDCNFFPMLSSIIRGKPPIITLKQAFKSECNFQLYLPKLWEADSPVIISVNCADHLINLHFKQILRKTFKTTFLPPPFLKLLREDCREQTSSLSFYHLS